MNSRQTYDEEEMLRKAIEESKGGKDDNASSRKGKRNRDESEEYARLLYSATDDIDTVYRDQQDTKRQRKNSGSIETGSTLNAASVDPDAESDEDATSGSRSALKKARAQAAELQREKDRREQEKNRVQQRAEAAKGRQARAGRRRADGESDPVIVRLHALSPAESESVETPKLEPTPLPPPSSQPPSPPTIELNPPSSSHKKGGKKAKRQGRNQYTKEKDTTSPSRKATASNSSGDENKSKPVEAATATATSSTAAPSKTSPNGSGQEAPAPVVKGKGRWKGKGRNAAAASDSDSKKDKSELTLKDMDRATQLMLDFLERNVPQQHIVTGHSMLRHASTPGMYGVSTNSSSVASVPDKPDDQLSSAEWADKLRTNIAEFRREFVTPTPGGLTV